MTFVEELAFDAVAILTQHVCEASKSAIDDERRASVVCVETRSMEEGEKRNE